MDEKTLKEHIAQVSKLPDEDLALLIGCAQRRELKKGVAVLKEGEVCRAFYLVNKGYLRTYHVNKDGVAINLNFTFEGNFTSNLRSYRGRRPSELTIEAGEDAELWIFPFSECPLPTPCLKECTARQDGMYSSKAQ